MSLPWTRDPGAEPSDPDPTTRFLAYACLTYTDLDEPRRWQTATEILAADPTLPILDLHVAAAVGDPIAVERHLTIEPESARALGGPWRWPALLHLTYARVPQRDPVAVAQLLVDAGADVNAGYLWRGQPTPFTALTGCFGGGEAGPHRLPRHPAGLELAELLLQSGADPNDAQTLYNRMFTPDDSHLRLLLAHGLGHGDGGVWARRLGDALESPDEMVRRQVDWARDHGLTERLDLLGSYGFREGTSTQHPSPWRTPDGPRPQDLIHTPADVERAAAAGVDLNARLDGQTMLHHAAWLGDVELIEALVAAGADPGIVDRDHGATPLGWAEWARADAAVEVLRAHLRGGASDR